MSNIGVLVVGFNTEEGRKACQLIKESSDMFVEAGLDSNSESTETFPIFDSWESLDSCYADTSVMGRFSVIVSFSDPDNCIEVMSNFAVPHEIPIVLAKGNFDEMDWDSIEYFSTFDLPIFVSKDMSVEDAIKAARFLANLPEKTVGLFDMESLK